MTNPFSTVLRTLMVFAAIAKVCVCQGAFAADKKSPSAAKSPEQVEADYTRAIEGRTKDILELLGLTDAAKVARVHDVIMAQYRALRAWHDANDPSVKALTKEAGQKNDAEAASKAQARLRQIQGSLKNIHDEFLASLSADLDARQLEAVKDKMTYNKVKVTYDAYVEIVPGLNEAEKARILELLKEAREEAMDCGSAEEKSAVFNRYKGKINNHLSANGHDVGKAYKDLRQKQKVTNSVVDDAALQRIYEEVKTPFKFGVVLRGAPDEKVDCPNVFRHGDKWFMMYIAFDGSGYETRLARSADLLKWETLGPILKRHGIGWDAEQAAAGLALIDYRWDGTWELQPYEGKYWLSYLGGSRKGYETPPLSIGLAYTEDPTAVKEWNRLAENPVLSPSDAGARGFEKDTLFKSHILRDPEKTLGAQFVLFYNARAPKDSERIGIAVSDDLRHWRRYGNEPVVENARPPDLKHGVISGDPQIVKIGDLWVMFYFGAFWKAGAFDTFAASRDLAHWTKWTGSDLITPSESWDKQFAHKPWVVRDHGTVYHFYCAVGDQGRVIALATSRDLRASADKAQNFSK